MINNKLLIPGFYFKVKDKIVRLPRSRWEPFWIHTRKVTPGDLDPTELTDEILRFNGFELVLPSSNNKIRYYRNLKYPIFYLRRIEGSTSYDILSDSWVVIKPIKYVHELQLALLFFNIPDEITVSNEN